MDQKNYAEVLIDGKIYKLGGSDDDMYLQKVAAYVNDKMSQLRKIEGFQKQSADYQTVMLALNIADDYYTAMAKAEEATASRAESEKDSYSLKHELITTQMKMEAAMKELEMEQQKVTGIQSEYDGLKARMEELTARELSEKDETVVVNASVAAENVMIDATQETLTAATVQSSTAPATTVPTATAQAAATTPSGYQNNRHSGHNRRR